MSITLKAARVNAGLTQREAGEIIGVSRDTISNWERFKSFPKSDKIIKICDLYKVNIDDLIFLPSNSA